MLEESFEVEVKRLWEATSGDILVRLGVLREGLSCWDRLFRGRRK